MSTNPPKALFATLLEPRAWSVEEYEALLEAGVLTRESKVELLAGIITKKKGTGSVDDFIVRAIFRALAVALNQDYQIGSQSPIHIPPNSRPEPDLWISKPNTGPHREATILAKDIAIVV